jgi:hypothetical protein
VQVYRYAKDSHLTFHQALQHMGLIYDRYGAGVAVVYEVVKALNSEPHSVDTEEDQDDKESEKPL